MNTEKFRTRQEFIKREHPKGKDYIVALDAGYSSMKVFYEGGYFCFPSYARKLEDVLTISSKEDILYRDSTGELFVVGRTAQDMISSNDTNDTDGELFSRKRYNNKIFKILCNTAIGMALLSKKDERKIIVQTGLPTSYVKGDSVAFKNALCKAASFELKIGNREWQHIDFSIEADNVFIMAQPVGSYYSVLIKSNGKYVSNSKDYLFNNTLVMDIGFGTFDLYGTKSRSVACEESIDDLGMREVLKHTSKKIFDELNEDIRVQALQKNLETGVVTCVNEEEMKTEDRELSPLLEASNNEVFKDAITRTREITNTFRDYKYLIVGGGTGEAWFENIKQYLSGMKSLTVVPSNINDPLPFIYSNVRGYYLLRYKNNIK